MGKFLEYNPDQAYLLPPSVRDVLGSGHLCFFVRRVVAKLNLSAFRDDYGSEGGPAYAPEMMVSVWLYAYALGVTSSRRLEQRIREDLAFRYLGGGAAPDHWTLNAFRRRHAKGLNDLFTRVVELARASGFRQFWDTWRLTRRACAANASRNRLDTEQALREKRARLGPRHSPLAEAVRRGGPERGCGHGSRLRSDRAAGAARGRNSRAAGTVSEIGSEETFADRSGQPISARAWRIHAGLHGYAGGE